MIFNYRTDGRNYQLLPPGSGFPGATNFTVIIGKNGTGKSRLLRRIVGAVLRDRVDPASFDRDERFGSDLFVTHAIDQTTDPKKVVCVSTSPFDRFPMVRRGEPTPLYSYLGLRGLPSSNLSTSYMARIMAALVSTAATEPKRIHSITEILKYLGYLPTIESVFVPSMSSVMLEHISSSKDVDMEKIDEYFRRPTSMMASDGGFALKNLRSSSKAEVLRAIEILVHVRRRSTKPRIYIDLSTAGVDVSSDLDASDALVLITTGMARLREVTLRKEGSPDRFNLTEASSGEQSVIMGLLGIGSQIEDGALICIDEPEVCLHPEWQERYVHLLLSAFGHYRGCQFLIATHSPQIVAELPQANCFVLDMASGDCVSSADLSHKSVDFQLARVFGTPGRRNEYLTKIAISLFTKLGRNVALSPENYDQLALLRRLKGAIALDDPLRELIEAISVASGGNE